MSWTHKRKVFYTREYNEHTIKRRKKGTQNTPIRVIGGNPCTKMWLVEWSDMSRTWETYETVKDMKVFKQWLDQLLKHNVLSVVKPFRGTPSYIN